MSDSDRLRGELRARLVGRSGGGSVLDRLCAGAVSALPVDGAAISVATDAATRADSGASDAICAHLDDLQFTLGEGPCWDAARDGHPVLVADLTGSGGRWPMFTPAALAAGFQAALAFPLQIGAIRLGTLGLVRARPGPLDRRDLADALTVADVAALTLIDLASGDPSGPAGPAGRSGLSSDPSLDVPWMHRAEIHQATGMVMAQLGVSAQEALVRLRAHAYAAGWTADDVAREIVSRRLRFHRD